MCEEGRLSSFFGNAGIFALCRRGWPAGFLESSVDAHIGEGMMGNYRILQGCGHVDGTGPFFL